MIRPSVSAAERRRLLEFVHAQSYGKTVSTVSTIWRPRIPGLDPSARPVPLEPGAAGQLTGLAYAPFQDAPARGEPLERIHAVLYGAMGLLRHEPANPYNPHRAFPSARSLFPIQAYLLQGAWAARYDPLGHRLEPVAGSGAPAGPARIALVGCPLGIPDSYGTLRYALTVLEAGHALYNLTAVARALGLRATVTLGFDDAWLMARLGLAGSEEWMPLAMVELEPGASEPEAHADARRPAPAAQEEPFAWLDRAGWLRAGEVAWWRAIEVPEPPSAPSQGRRDLKAAVGLPSLEEVLYTRSSGRSTAGLSAQVTRVPGELVHTALHLGLRRPPLELSTRAVSPSGLRFLLVAERVSGLDDGLYELFPESGALVCRRQGRLLSGLQQAFSYPPINVNILSMNAAWLLVVDPPQVIDRWGARGVRLANLELGWVAQGLGCAMAAHGLFARPTRSFDEARLDELLGLGPGEMVGYQILCGLSRFHDFLFDLRLPPIGQRKS